MRGACAAARHAEQEDAGGLGGDAVCIATSAGEGYRLILPKQRTQQEVAPDPVGRDAFLTGTFLFSQRNPASLLAARQQFELACERNPEFAWPMPGYPGPAVF